MRRATLVVGMLVLPGLAGKDLLGAAPSPPPAASAEACRPIAQNAAGGPPYIRAAQCGICHRAVYAAWRSTPHARAIETLAGEGKRVVPECLRCHSEAFRRSPDALPEDQGVECASCHGDGISHALRPSSGGVTARPAAEACAGCHTPYRSPGFAFATASGRVHPRPSRGP